MLRGANPPYERNPAFYGQQYAGIKYRFTYFEISIRTWQEILMATVTVFLTPSNWGR